LNAFTVDVEDYFQVSAFERHVPKESWRGRESRVAQSNRKILDLLARKQVKATFFILGWIAREFPELVREIHAAGHELASHSYWHRLVYSLSPEEFRQDLRDSREAIFEATGVTVKAYRAPSFSITRKSLWALDILAEEGFTVDSSVFPTRHDRYGIPGAKLEIHPLATAAGSVLEFPPTVAKLAWWNMPTGGGGYFRLYPWWFTKHLLSQVNRSGRPFMFYVHPWEVDPDQPRMAFASLGTRFRHYVNLATTATKLERLLDTFRFGTLSEVIAQHAACPTNSSTAECAAS
jgi:polysaccharide deacetylase family protein (PEP-CTERM system associated)